MNESYRRNESWANAKWGPSTPIIHRQAINTKSSPKWIHSEKDLDRASSLFLLGTAMQMRNQQQRAKRSRHDLKKQSAAASTPDQLQRKKFPVPKSSTSTVLETLVKQQQHERWLELLPTNSMSRKSSRKSLSSSSSGGEHKWNERIQEVKEFVRDHGHGRIPLSYPQNQELARWSKRQRYHYKIYLKNKRKKFYGLDSSVDERCFMTQERLQDLKEAGFCFELQTPHNYQQLMKRSKSCPAQRFQLSLLKKQQGAAGQSFLNSAQQIVRNNNSQLKMSSIFAPNSQPQSQTPMELCLRGLQVLGNDVVNPPNSSQEEGRDDSSKNTNPTIDSVPKEIVLVEQEEEQSTLDLETEPIQDAY